MAVDLDATPAQAEDSTDHVAVVDLGSNSIRLVVYDCLSRAPFPRFNEKSLCRLGAHITDEGNLSEPSMRCVARALERFAAIARAMDVRKIDLLATESIRKAGNGAEFQKELEQISGLPLKVLTGEEEARLASLGVIAGFHKPQGLVGDLGGGSLELAEIRQDEMPSKPVSMPLGALHIMRRMADDVSATKAYIDDLLADALPLVVTSETFYVVGGGWRALAKVYLANNTHPVPVIHGLTLDSRTLRDLAKSLWRMSPDELEKLPGVPGRRLSTLPAAALVMDRVLKRLKPGTVVFSALGVREGWLYDQLSTEQRHCDPLITGCQLLSQESSRVPKFAHALDRWSERLFLGESHEQQRLRLAIIALSDIAWRERSDVQAQHAFERILRFPFLGVTHPERVFIAAAVHSRYGRRAKDEALSLLDEETANRAHVIGTALLLGYRFSGSVPEILDQATIDIDASTVTLSVDRSASVPDSDAVQARLDLLAKAMGREKTAVIERD